MVNDISQGQYENKTKGKKHTATVKYLMNIGCCYQLTEGPIKHNPIKRLGKERQTDRLSGDIKRSAGKC